MKVGETRFVLRLGDITEEEVDAIVNAANSSLLGGGGVDGAIHRAGGPAVLEACERVRAERGECATGDAVVTTAGELSARWVVHTVGPVWRGGGEGEPGLLRRCYRRSLALAADEGARTIAFPAISTGVYGYPVAEAAPIALRAAIDHARERPGFTEIRFLLISGGDLAVYERALAALDAEPEGET